MCLCVSFLLLSLRIIANLVASNRRNIIYSFVGQKPGRGSWAKNQHVSRWCSSLQVLGETPFSAHLGCFQNSFICSYGTEFSFLCWVSSGVCPQLLEATCISWLMAPFFHLQRQEWQVEFLSHIESLLFPPCDFTILLLFF